MHLIYTIMLDIKKHRQLGHTNLIISSLTLVLKYKYV